MIRLNNGTINGNLVKDPEIRNIGDKTVCAMRIAHNDKVEKAHFFNVEAWNGLAKSCANLKKGSHVIVEYRLAQDQWEKDGQQYSVVKLVASDIHFVPGSGKKDDDIPFD